MVLQCIYRYVQLQSYKYSRPFIVLFMLLIMITIIIIAHHDLLIIISV